MNALLRLPLNIVALLLFAALAMDHLPGLLQPLFEAFEGDPHALGAVWGLSSSAAVLATWIWSARR